MVIKKETSHYGGVNFIKKIKVELKAVLTNNLQFESCISQMNLALVFQLMII